MEQVETIFSTVAKDCQTFEEKLLYLMACRKRGLDPMRGELHAFRSQGRIMLTTDYGVYVRKALACGYYIRAAAVCAGDTWGGFDTVLGIPAQHITTNKTRGAVIGAWANATNVKNGVSVGLFFDFNDLVRVGEQGSLGRWKTNPQQMATKEVIKRVCRLVDPGFEDLDDDELPPDVTNVQNVTQIPVPAPDPVADVDAETGEVKPPENCIKHAKRILDIAREVLAIRGDDILSINDILNIATGKKSRPDQIDKYRISLEELAAGKMPEKLLSEKWYADRADELEKLLAQQREQIAEAGK